MTVLQVLSIGGDEALRDELEVGFDGGEMRTIIRHAADAAEGTVLARDLAPAVVVVDLDVGAAALKRLSDELAECAPAAILLAAYSPRTLDSQGSASSAILIDAVRGNVRDFLRRPVSARELEDALRRHHDGSVRDEPSFGKITTFFSNKGGVGKSTVALNTAAYLAKRHPGRVLLVDASLQLGVCASAFDLAPESTLVDAVRQASRLDPTLLRSLVTEHSSGLAVLAAPPDAVDAAEIDEATMSRVLSVSRRAYDHVIVDTFPVLDGVALAAIDLSDKVFIITSGLVPVVSGVGKLIEVLEKIGCTRQRQQVVLNHAQPTFAGALRAQDIASRLDRDVAHVVPFDKRALVAMNIGVPAVLGGRLGGFRRAIVRLANDVASPVADKVNA